MNHTLNTEGNRFCVPFDRDEEALAKGTIIKKIYRIFRLWGMFGKPLDADIIIDLFGHEGIKHYSVTDTSGSKGRSRSSYRR